MPIPAPAHPHPASGGVLGVLAATGADHDVDLDKLIAGRLLLCANSGGGKSRTLRRLLESTFGQVPHHVIDPEGEFHTLRDAGYDYILAGKGYDCPTEPAHAQHLARKMLELGTSVVLDLYELEPQQRIDFVAGYVRGLIDAPKHLWQRALIVVDEAHTFCPEKGEEDGRDVKECRSAVISLMSLGRKRGFCGVLATQRLAKLAKSAAAEANNVLIGRARQDVDADRALKALGARVADHDLRQQIRSLKPGHFFASGPALGDEVVEIHVGDVRSAHPEAGAQKAPASPPPATIKRVLAQLADLPQQAEAELRTVDELRARVRELEAAAGDQLPPAPEPAIDVEALVRRGVESMRNSVHVMLGEAIDSLAGFRDGLVEDAGHAVELALEHAPEQAMQAEAALAAGEAACVRRGRSVLTGGKLDGSDRGPPLEPRRQSAPAAGGAVTGPMRRVLDALAWFEALGIPTPTRQQVAHAADYSMGGTFANLLGAARGQALLDYPQAGTVALTAAGRRVATRPDVPTERRGEFLQRYVMEKMNGPQQRVLQVLIPLRGKALKREDLAERTGYSVGGTFANVVGSLHTLGVVEYPRRGEVAAARILYGEVRS